jgi:hypothetical protein
VIFIAETYRELFRQIGFTPEMIFTDPGIKVWRKLPDRENCTWEIATRKLHVKRYKPARNSQAQQEAAGYEALTKNNIPTATIVIHGSLEDGRSFFVTEDLTGFTPADKLIESGHPFDQLLLPTADLTARLHTAGLHHRDLYLCHFLLKGTDLRLIDAARVRPFPGPITRRRWILKDLAQFWYSAQMPQITDEQRNQWLTRYCEQTKISRVDSLRKSMVRKSDAIAVHDKSLRLKQPLRNISIPETR